MPPEIELRRFNVRAYKCSFVFARHAKEPLAGIWLFSKAEDIYAERAIVRFWWDGFEHLPSALGRSDYNIDMHVFSLSILLDLLESGTKIHCWKAKFGNRIWAGIGFGQVSDSPIGNTPRAPELEIPGTVKYFPIAPEQIHWTVADGFPKLEVQSCGPGVVQYGDVNFHLSPFSGTPRYDHTTGRYTLHYPVHMASDIERFLNLAKNKTAIHCSAKGQPDDTWITLLEMKHQVPT